MFGWWQFAGWTVLALVQIATIRYMRRFWQSNMLIHAISGSVIFLETLVAGVVGTVKHGFQTTWHSIVGYLILFICFIISVYGFFAWWY